MKIAHAIVSLVATTTIITADPGADAQNGAESLIWHKNSFKAPFDNFESHSGSRKVNDYWSAGGDTDVNHNYIRLTNDRQDKRGWLYNSEPIKARDFSIQVKFRVSGQGQSLFGDGFVLWVVQNKMHEFSKSGDFFAGPRGFTGFAIVFDTYKNAEMATTHKDIYLLSNDGNAELDIHAPLAGCIANYRWFEKRDDFSVKDYAIARVSYNSGRNSVKVEIDGANTDKFVDCLEFELPHGQMIDGSHIALSATTGQLADNHDILAVDTTSYGTYLPHDDEKAGLQNSKIVQLEKQIREMHNGPELLSLMQLWRQEQEKHFNHLHHQFEHELEFMRDSMMYMVNQVRDAEKDDSQRIKKLEEAAAEAAKKAAESNLVHHIESAKAELHASRQGELHELKQKTERDLRQLKANMEDTVKDVVEVAQSAGGGDTMWKASTVILLVLIMVILVVFFRKYKQINNYKLP